MPLNDGLFPILMLLLITLFAAMVAFDSEVDRRRTGRSDKRREGA